MRYPLLALLLIATHYLAACNTPDTVILKDGDIIFQSSKAGQGYAVQLATRSKYSHCGIIYKENGVVYVYEAIQPVKKTPLKKWIERGDDSHYVIKRLKNDKVLTSEKLNKMKQEAKKHLDKDYDLPFEWSDDQMYCSELVWKIYKRVADIEVGSLQKLKDFNLENNIVKEKLSERYGATLPLEQTVTSPAAIYASELLETVAED